MNNSAWDKTVVTDRMIAPLGCCIPWRHVTADDFIQFPPLDEHSVSKECALSNFYHLLGTAPRITKSTRPDPRGGGLLSSPLGVSPRQRTNITLPNPERLSAAPESLSPSSRARTHSHRSAKPATRARVAAVTLAFRCS